MPINIKLKKIFSPFSKFGKIPSGFSVALIRIKKFVPKKRLLPKNLSLESLWSIIFVQGFFILTLLGIGAWAYWTYIKPPMIERNVPIQPSYVEAAPVELGTFETFITVMGTLKANESVIIRPEIEGKIKAVNFKSGDFVKEGDVLIQLEDQVYKSLEKESVAKVLLYKGKYERASKLYAKKAGTLKDKEENFAQLKIAEAEFEKAHNQLAKTVIKAPFSGVIGFKDIGVGAYVRPGEELVTLDDLDPVKVDFKVGENMIDRVFLDQRVEVEIEGFKDNRFEGVIEAIDSNVDAIGHNVRIRAILENKEDLFKPGLFGRVKLLESAHEDVLMVPESAIENKGNRELVYVIENEKASMVPVKVGNRNGEKVEILSGLEPGQIVVTAGQMRFRERENPVVVLPNNTLKKLM